MDSRVYEDIRTPCKRSKLAERRLDKQELHVLKRACMILATVRAVDMKRSRTSSWKSSRDGAVLSQCGKEVPGLDRAYKNEERKQIANSQLGTVLHEEQEWKFRGRQLQGTDDRVSV